MVGKTLFLTGGMPHESKQHRISKAKVDSNTHSVHIVGQDFNDEDEKVASELLRELFVAQGRKWRTVKLHSCRGKRMGSALFAVMKSSTRRLVVQSPFNEDATTFMPHLSRGLSLNSTMLTLCLYDIRLNKASIELLRGGLEKNHNLAELSFNNSTFSGDSVSESLGECLQAWSQGQRLSFEQCKMSDEACGIVVSALEGHHSLRELCLEGNHCKTIAFQRLGSILPTTSLRVIDVASQQLGGADRRIELEMFSSGLAGSQVSILHLSGNVFHFEDVQSLSQGISINQCLRMLDLAWCDFSNSEFMIELSNGLCHNSVLSTLVLYDCSITDDGLSQFARCMHLILSLKKLDIGGKQMFGERGIVALTSGLEKSTELEEVKLPRRLLSRKTQFLCDANKGGRRYLKSQHESPIGLYPLILERVGQFELSSCLDSLEEDLATFRGSGACETERRLSILYHLVRRGPALTR